MAKNESERVIGEVELLEGRKKLVLVSQRYMGKQWINLREWVPLAGEWKPTRKGVVFTRDFLNDVLALLSKAGQCNDQI